MNPITLVIVDDHQIVRDGIKAMLLCHKEINVIGEAADCIELYTLLEQNQPDIIVLDISMPGKTGVEITRELIEKNPETKILILTANTDEQSIMDSIKAGAAGFLNKDTSREEFISAIKSIYHGEGYFGEKLSKIIYRSYIQHIKSVREPEKEIGLSEREIQIVKLFSEGLSSKEIADKIFLSPRTVETHKSNILEKLNLKNNIELVKYAIKNGIIEL
jgi:DNA-binding NarL/FixJ family response regulator